MLSMFKKKKTPKNVGLQNSRTSEVDAVGARSNSARGSNLISPSDSSIAAIVSQTSPVSKPLTPSISPGIPVTPPDPHQPQRGHVPRNLNRSISLRAPYQVTSKKKIEYRVGDHVKLTDRRTGWIRYIGKLRSTRNSSNKNANKNEIWYGIELDEQFEGKHSGLVDGFKYFDTSRAMSGILVRYNLLQGHKQEINALKLSKESRGGHGRKLSSMIYRTDSAPHSYRDRAFSNSGPRFASNNASALASPSNLMTPDTVGTVGTTNILSDSEYNSMNLQSPQPHAKMRVSFVVPNYDHLLLGDEKEEDGYDSDENNNNNNNNTNLQQQQQQAGGAINQHSGQGNNLSLIDATTASQLAQILTEEEIAMRDKTVTLSMRDEDVDMMNDISIYSTPTPNLAINHTLGNQMRAISEENSEFEDQSGGSSEEEEEEDDESDGSDSEEDESDGGNSEEDEEEDDRVIEKRSKQQAMVTQVRGSVVVKSTYSSGQASASVVSDDNKETETQTSNKIGNKIEKMAPLQTTANEAGLFGLWADTAPNFGLTSSLVNDGSDLSSSEDDMKPKQSSNAIEQASPLSASDKVSSKAPSPLKNGKKSKKKKGKKGKKSSKSSKKSKKHKKTKDKKSSKKSKKSPKKRQKQFKVIVSDDEGEDEEENVRNKPEYSPNTAAHINEVDKILGAARDYGLMTEEEIRKAKRRGKHEFKKISQKEARRMRRKRLNKQSPMHAIRVQIPIGDLNSFCMRKILTYLTIMDLAEWSVSSRACRDCTRLVPKYDLRDLLRGYCSIQQTRKVLSVLSYHKPQELIFPLAYFIYDPVILRLFLTYFNVDIPSHLSMNMQNMQHNGNSNNSNYNSDIYSGINSPQSVTSPHYSNYTNYNNFNTGGRTKRSSTIDNSGVAASVALKHRTSKKGAKNRAIKNKDAIASDEEEGGMIRRVQSDVVEAVIADAPTPKYTHVNAHNTSNTTNNNNSNTGNNQGQRRQQGQFGQPPPIRLNARPQPAQQMFKYIHRIVIDDRDIRPSKWIMRPGNFPWCELGKDESNDKFPIELVDCFHTLGNRLWYVDVRYTENIELAYFAPSQHSVQVLAVNAQNRYDIEHFSNLKELIIENPKITEDEIDRSDILDWKGAWNSLKTLHLVNQRFNCSKIDLFESVSWLRNLENVYISGCRFNEPHDMTLNEDLVRTNGNAANKVSTFKIKNQRLTSLFVDLLVTLFPRISNLKIIECRVGKAVDWSFALQFRHLTRISIIDLKTKLRKKNSIESYNMYLQDIYDTLSSKLTNSPIVIESNARGNPFTIASHIKCKYCGKLVDKRFMDDHLSVMCLKRYIDCPLCRTKVLRGGLSKHWENRCINYRIICMLCGQTFATNERTEYTQHIWNHTLSLDRENGKYELVFANHPFALTLKNDYSVYLVANCRNCNHRVIQSTVSDKYIKHCIPNQCEVCDPMNIQMYEQTKTMPKYLKQEISPSRKVLALTNAKKVLPHPFRRKSGSHSSQKSQGNSNLTSKNYIDHSKKESVGL